MLEMYDGFATAAVEVGRLVTAHPKADRRPGRHAALANEVFDTGGYAGRSARRPADSPVLSVAAV